VEERQGLGGKVRATLTPGPSPALRERGDLVYERGIVERRRRRIAAALLISPLPLPVEERQGLGGKVRAALTPSFPRVGAEVGQEEGEGATLPLPLPQRGRGRGLGGR
jgi:hypothetical protein